MTLTPIRVLVVDDSAFMRKILSDLLSADAEIEVVGTARNGKDALTKAAELNPDVITLDVEMPVMDGLTALQALLRERPVPVVMVSSLTQAGAETTIRALTLGAVDFVGKPSGHISLDMHKVAEELVRKVRTAARARVRVPRSSRAGRTRRGASGASTRSRGSVDTASAVRKSPPAPAVRKSPPAHVGTVPPIVVIGCSTGGPGALFRVLPQLPADLGAAVIVVQHMPPGFTHSLAMRLDESSPFCVREAAEGDQLTAGLALFAPGGKHLTVDAAGVVHLDEEPPLHGVRPAVDRTLHSVAEHHAARSVAVIMTGMGFDGARGVVALRRAGGRAIAEDESTCVVYGMPRAVIEMGQADRVVPLDEIAATIMEMVR